MRLLFSSRDFGRERGRPSRRHDFAFHSQRGATTPLALFAISVVTLAVLVALLVWNTHQGRDRTDAVCSLTLYCAAGLEPPVKATARRFESEYGVRIDIQYGGSGTLLSALEVARRGDLFLAADDGYLDLAREKNLVREVFPVARLVPGIGVASGNPKNIHSLDDLLKPDVTFALANPDAAAVGKVVRHRLEDVGMWDDVRARCKVLKPTVTDLANDLALGTIDAALVWDATANQYDAVDFIADERLVAGRRDVAIGVLASSPSPAAALRFVRYLTAPERGGEEFARHRYTAVAGDPWEETPRLTLFSGAMLRPGVENVIAEFERREGVRIDPTWNGCGILVSQMRAGSRPDAYISCDVSFMDMVQDRFAPPVDLTTNDLVVVVAKGNPRDVGGLADLARDNLRLGLADPERSALGALTTKALRHAGVHDDVVARKALDSPTGDFLVNQLRAGALDAIVVYRSNARAHAGNRDVFDIVEIDAAYRTAKQNYAVARSTRFPHLTARFLDALHTDRSRERFESVGFGWRGERTR